MANRAERRRAERAGAKRPVAPPVGPIASQPGPGAPQGAPGITVNVADLLQKIGALTVEIDFWKGRTSQLEQDIRQVLAISSSEPSQQGTEEAPINEGLTQEAIDQAHDEIIAEGSVPEEEAMPDIGPETGAEVQEIAEVEGQAPPTVEQAKELE